MKTTFQVVFGSLMNSGWCCRLIGQFAVWFIICQAVIQNFHEFSVKNKSHSVYEPIIQLFHGAHEFDFLCDLSRECPTFRPVTDEIGSSPQLHP